MDGDRRGDRGEHGQHGHGQGDHGGRAGFGGDDRWAHVESREPLRNFHPQHGGSMGVGPFSPDLARVSPYETPGYGQGAGGRAAYGAYVSPGYPGYGGSERGRYVGGDYGSRYGYGSGTTGEYGGPGTVGGFAGSVPGGGGRRDVGLLGRAPEAYARTAPRGSIDLPEHGTFDRPPRRERSCLPRGYARADECVREDVCLRLVHGTGVDLEHMEVSVKDGVVHLLGSVPTGRDRGLVERVARGVRGVKAVSNDLDTIDDRAEPAGGEPVAGD